MSHTQNSSKNLILELQKQILKEEILKLNKSILKLLKIQTALFEEAKNYNIPTNHLLDDIDYSLISRVHTSLSNHIAYELS